MRDEADFAAYVAARWPLVVRSVVLVGCPRERAEGVATEGLARCRSAWHALRAEGDPDVGVYRAVVDQWRRELRERRHATAPASVPQPVPATVPEQEDEAVALCREVEAELAALAPERREAVVLRFVAGLRDDQVADVLETRFGAVTGARPAEDYRRASETIEVSPVSLAAIAAAADRRRSLRLRRTVLGVVAVVAVLGLLGWATWRPAHPPELAPGVTRAPNPADRPWYAAGTLHLEHVTVELPALTGLVQVGSAAVYGDAAGRVALVTGDGERTFIGRKDPRAELVGSTSDGWAAWVDVTDERFQVVVYDVAAHRQVAWDTEVGSQPIAIDNGTVFYRTPAGVQEWSPPEAPHPYPGEGLVASGATAQVYQRSPGRIEMVQKFFSVSFVRPGVGARLSPGGLHVLTHAPGRPPEPGVPFRPLLYDDRTGDRLPTGLAPDELVLDAAFGPNHTVDYLVVDRRDVTGGADLSGRLDPLVVLRTCELTSGQCSDVVPIAHAGAEPLLAD